MNVDRIVQILEKVLIGYRVKVTGDDHLKTFCTEYTSAQTGTVIVTPTSGKRAVPKSIGITTTSEAGEVRMVWGTSGIPIAILYCTKTNNVAFVGISNQNGEVDETIKLTTTTGTEKVFVGIDYAETD